MRGRVKCSNIILMNISKKLLKHTNYDSTSEQKAYLIITTL
jgi:hypothetical protein